MEKQFTQEQLDLVARQAIEYYKATESEMIRRFLFRPEPILPDSVNTPPRIGSYILNKYGCRFGVGTRDEA